MNSRQIREASLTGRVLRPTKTGGYRNPAKNARRKLIAKHGRRQVLRITKAWRRAQKETAAHGNG